MYIEGDNGYIYLIRNPATALTKIGKSKSYRNRIRKIENESGIEMELIAIYYDEEDEMSLSECILHETFSDKRKLGEWFDLDIVDLAKAISWMEGHGLSRVKVCSDTNLLEMIDF